MRHLLQALIFLSLMYLMYLMSLASISTSACTVAAYPGSVRLQWNSPLPTGSLFVYPTTYGLLVLSFSLRGPLIVSATVIKGSATPD